MFDTHEASLVFSKVDLNQSSKAIGMAVCHGRPMRQRIQADLAIQLLKTAKKLLKNKSSTRNVPRELSTRN